jgi:hypothetical protein
VDQPIPDFIRSVVDPSVEYERPNASAKQNGANVEEEQEVAEPEF